MKARNRHTDEIVDIIAYSGTTQRLPTDTISYIAQDGSEHTEGLNYYWDFEPVEDFIDPNWEDVRIKAAIAAMQSIIPDQKGVYMLCDAHKKYSDAASSAVKYADALIKELKI